ncbi:MAG: prolipoprotein diacylglyceryl transferase [Eggerthellaceae bacterium]|nr:prolipoprotein diacylglyceryl transferase [Eggerthellaceae bacterium]
MLNNIYQALDPVAFALGPIEVRWYGLAYMLAFLLCSLLFYRIAKRWEVKLDYDAMLNVAICVMLGTILGARLGYVIFYGDGHYWSNPLSILNLSQGGMSFHGGLIGVIIGGFAASRITGASFLTLADLGAITAPIGLFLGRCANFVNGELWGAPTDMPWGVIFGGSAGMIPRHPTQLYEAVLEGLVILCVLYLLSRKVPPRPQGTFIGSFLLLYGIFRFAIEFVRQPDAHMGYLFFDWVTMGQLLSLPLIVAGIGLLVFAAVKKLPQRGMPEEECAEL